MSEPCSPDFVTDHALVRYLERVLDFDVESVRSSIAKETADAISVGAAGMRIDGRRYIFKNGYVITVMLTSNEMRKAKAIRTGESHD